jgi:alkanesulfonate monooxygenase SsuD/methylene tetrahydromethanopterin reductase-like flavin-dependent oxidoreductase (luciferase family)
MLAWNQYTTWPAMRAAAVRADELGYDDVWTWDHIYPIVGSVEGPILEGWLVLAGWAGATLTVLIREDQAVQATPASWQRSQ